MRLAALDRSLLGLALVTGSSAVVCATQMHGSCVMFNFKFQVLGFECFSRRRAIGAQGRLKLGLKTKAVVLILMQLGRLKVRDAGCCEFAVGLLI
jgi:hypothetical protein